MKSSRKVNKTASLAQQKLPSSTFPDAALESQSAPFQNPTSPASTLDSASLSSFQRILLEISHQAIQVRRSKTGRSEVVLKTDTETDLILRLSSHGETVEVSGKVECGDLATIQTHWPRLQQILSVEGIHLAALPSTSQRRRSSVLPVSNSSFGPEEVQSFSELYCVGSVTEPLRRPHSKSTIVR